MSIIVKKREYLSGDDAAFKSIGKDICRLAWHKHSSSLSEVKDRKLNCLWLANNQFTDIDDLLPVANSFVIPDNNAMNRAAKRKTLVNKYHLPKKNDKIKVVKSVEEICGTNKFFDVINLDTCNHLDKATLDSIEKLVHLQADDISYLFATFSSTSLRSVTGVKFPQYKRLSGTQEGIKEILEGTFSQANFKHKMLVGFPLTYETGLDRINHMHSFGWELTRI